MKLYIKENVEAVDMPIIQKLHKRTKPDYITVRKVGMSYYWAKNVEEDVAYEIGSEYLDDNMYEAWWIKENILIENIKCVSLSDVIKKLQKIVDVRDLAVYVTTDTNDGTNMHIDFCIGNDGLKANGIDKIVEE